MTHGYKALHESAAIIDRQLRTRIRATGEDRARLLHALTTNHIQQLLPGHGCYAFFLSAQGRILSDANIFAFAEHLLIDAEPEVRTSLFHHIDHYIIADDVTLYDNTDTSFCLDVAGPSARSVLESLRAPIPADMFQHAPWQDVTVSRVPEGFRIFGPPERRQPTVDLLYLPVATPEDTETRRIEQRIPRYSADITEKYLAAETSLTHALHFQKGCYLGQEIVERVRSRAHVNRHLVALDIDNSEVPAPGTKPLDDEGKEVGVITSSAYSPARKHDVALAYVRVPHDRPGSQLNVGTAKATVIPIHIPS